MSPKTFHRQINVDFMDMTNDGRLWVRDADARPGVEVAVGRHVGDEDADADPNSPGPLPSGTPRGSFVLGLVGYRSRSGRRRSSWTMRRS